MFKELEEKLNVPIINTRRVSKGQNVDPDDDRVTMTIEARSTEQTHWTPQMQGAQWIENEKLFLKVLHTFQMLSEKFIL